MVCWCMATNLSSYYFYLFQISVGHLIKRSSGAIVSEGSQTIIVYPEASVKDIIDLSVQRHSLLNSNFNKDSHYRLLFRDRTEVVLTPGSGEAFTLNRYHHVLNKPYSKIHFYLMTENLWRTTPGM